MTLQSPFLLEDKKKLLNVASLSQVEEDYSYSALKILKERYLLKDDKGNTIERTDQLLKRVAVGVGIMEVLYDDMFYDINSKSTVINAFYDSQLADLEKELKELDYKDMYDHPLCIDLPYGFVVNPFHYERLFARYNELRKEGRMKVSFESIITTLIKGGDFKLKIIPLIQKYYSLMASRTFLPNTPALMNCGTKLNMNAACFTLRMKDDLDHIYKTYADIAKIFKAGGGIGINYSELREEGAFVKGTGGKSSGTLSWLTGTDETTGRVAQGGKRRGASMAILNWRHPEIERFIDMKADNKSLLNHNISVCADDTFFNDALTKKYSRARYLLDRISKNAWISGDPGMVFLDSMNYNNLLEAPMGYKIDVTNPCSEISMYPYESCILASINLAKFVNNCAFDYKRFGEVTQTVTQFLDSMIDATKYPIEEINEMTKSCRRIGVGFMGIADTLVQLKIPYNSKKGFEFTEGISKQMTLNALIKSVNLAAYKGAFPLYNHKDYPQEVLPITETIKEYGGSKLLRTALTGTGFRNCSVTTVAPTGTLSMLADCSSGIEPLFSLKYTKKVTIGDFEYLDKNYEKALKEGMSEEDIRHIFVTAMDIHPYDHLMMQSVSQKWITNGISKTINMSSDVSDNMIENAYILSWAMGNKGISVYRDGCKGTQVLNSDKKVSSADLKVSDYTKEKIQKLDKIPSEYKDRMLSVSADISDVSDTKNTINVCPNCFTENTIEVSNRGTCQICRTCGHSIGSCN